MKDKNIEEILSEFDKEFGSPDYQLWKESYAMKAQTTCSIELRHWLENALQKFKQLIKNS